MPPQVFGDGVPSSKYMAADAAFVFYIPVAGLSVSIQAFFMSVCLLTQVTL